MGNVSEIDLTQVYDAGKSLNESAPTISSYSMDGWFGRVFNSCSFFDRNKPIAKFRERELHDVLHKEPTSSWQVGTEGISESAEPRMGRSAGRSAPELRGR